MQENPMTEAQMTAAEAMTLADEQQAKADAATLGGKPLATKKLGSLNMVAARENFSNCLALTFQNANDLNTYAEQNPGLLFVQVTPLADGRWSATAARMMTQEEYLELVEIQNEVSRIMQERKEAREAGQREAEAAEARAEAEARELQALGRVCKEKHAELEVEGKEVKKLRMKLASLQAELEGLRRKKGK